MEPAILKDGKHFAFRKNIRKFVEEEIRPGATSWEQKKYFPADLLSKLASKGFLGASLPSRVGGGGKDFWHEVILAEELARSKALGWALSMLVQSNMLAPLIFQLGTAKQKEEILKPALRGDFYLALAATDPSSGSDLASISTTATLSGRKYVLNGEKRYITNGSVAGYYVVLARTGTKNNIWSLSLFLVPAGIKGLSRRRLDTAGLKTGDTASVVFKNCEIPKENVLGDSTKGFLYLLRGLHRERLIGAVALNSLALYVWEETLDFLKNRTRFNEPLVKKQVISHRLIELRTTIEAARQFTYAACDSFSKEAPVDKEILMLKIFCYENCQKVIEECIHLYGGEGFLSNNWLSHARQDSR
jgi:alkylation response protein AidB-like acyl-CoA dehydrogenase